MNFTNILLRGMVVVGALSQTVAVARPSVAIAFFGERPALQAIGDGVKDALAKAGYTEASGLKWQFQTARGDTAAAARMARQLVGAKPDVIVAVSTPSAEAVAAATKTIPIVYSAVADPVAARLVESMGPSGTNITGVSDSLALEKQIDLIKKVAPEAKRVGMIYNPSDPASVAVVKRMRELLPKSGMSLSEATARHASGVGAAARNLIGRADVIYTVADGNVASAYESVVKVGDNSKIPLVASGIDGVKLGASAALGINYYDLGVQTGKMVIKILRGQKPGEMPSETSGKLDLYVNPGAAAKQGVVLSDDLVRSASNIVE